MPFPCEYHGVGVTFVMDNKNCDQLFEYLRSILYDTKVKKLDIEELEEPYRKLGMGLQYLDQAVSEMKDYAEALSIGKLSADPPSRDNFLCENLKNIHANLSHLTWQAKQVAKGDYSQTVSYLGEFSEAFNTMTRQLKEREETLKEEAEIEKKHASMLEGYNQLLLELISRSDEEILVVSVAEQKLLYYNDNADVYISPEEIYELCLRRLRKQKIDSSQQDTYEWTWEVEDHDHHFYRITTGFIMWQGQRAWLHIIREVTDEKNRQARLEAEAYQDQLTGIGNRHYFNKKIMELRKRQEYLIFCYCDLDHLKEVNDRYGHLEGDWYICRFVEIAQAYIRKGDVLARVGGDEFCMILRDCPEQKADRRMQKIREVFRQKDEQHPYEKDFSYGIVEVPAENDSFRLEEIIQQADEVMYRHKRDHKRAEQEKGSAGDGE